MQADGLLEVGRIGRPHGVRGDVFLHLTTDRVERAAVGSRLRVRDRWVTITRSARSNDRWRVHLDGVDDRSAAEALTGATVHAEPIDDADALWVHRLIGARVVEVDGTDRGRCVAVIENPASDLLELESGALVPAVFVTAVDMDASDTSATSASEAPGDVSAGAQVVVTIDPPDGLFDLDAEG